MDEGYPVRSIGAMRRRAVPRRVRPAQLPSAMEAPPRTQRSIRELRMAERATQGPLPTDFANSTKEVDSQVSSKRGGLALRKQTGQDVDWSALSEQTKRVAQVISETNVRSSAQLGHQYEKYRQLTEAQGTAHAEMRDNRPDAMRRHAQEMRQLVRDLQPEHRVAVANATVARALRGYPQHFFYAQSDDSRTTTAHSGFRLQV